MVGTRFTIGAVVEADGERSWVVAPQLPPASYLNPKLRLLLERALDALASEPGAGLPRNPFPPKVLDERPGARPPRLSHLGNRSRTEPPQRAPEVEDPLAWVRLHCLPQRPDATAEPSSIAKAS